MASLMYDRKECPPPARNVRDSRAPPTSFRNLAVNCDTPLTRAEVLTLIQTKSAPTCAPHIKTGNCHKCGKSGHWENECPDNSNSPSGRPQRSCPKGGRRSFGRSQNQRSNDTPSWRTTPPANDAPSTKVHNDKTFNWCSQCHCWTTTHNTSSTHTGTQRPAPPSSRLLIAATPDPLTPSTLRITP